MWIIIFEDVETTRPNRPYKHTNTNRTIMIFTYSDKIVDNARIPMKGPIDCIPIEHYPRPRLIRYAVSQQGVEYELSGKQLEDAIYYSLLCRGGMQLLEGVLGMKFLACRDSDYFMLDFSGFNKTSLSSLKARMRAVGKLAFNQTIRTMHWGANGKRMPITVKQEFAWSWISHSAKDEDILKHLDYSERVRARLIAMGKVGPRK